MRERLPARVVLPNLYPWYQTRSPATALALEMGNPENKTYRGCGLAQKYQKYLVARSVGLTEGGLESRMVNQQGDQMAGWSYGVFVVSLPPTLLGIRAGNKALTWEHFVTCWVDYYRSRLHIASLGVMSRSVISPLAVVCCRCQCLSST